MGFQVVDVRSPGEFADGHMPGPLNFPLLDDAQRARGGRRLQSRKGAVRGRLGAVAAQEPAVGHHVLAGRRSGAATWCCCWRWWGVHALTVDRRLPRLPERGAIGAGRLAAARARATPCTATRGRQERLATGAGRLAPGLEGTAALGRRPERIGSPPRLAAGRGEPARRTEPEGFRFSRFGTSCAGPGRDYLVLEGESARIGQIYLPGSVGDAIRGGSRCWSSPRSRAGGAHRAGVLTCAGGMGCSTASGSAGL